MKKLSDLAKIERLSIKELFSIKGGIIAPSGCTSSNCRTYACFEHACLTNACDSYACSSNGCSNYTCESSSNKN